jgi:drug/metabolite transporter (DMT)-like permease
VVSTAAPTAPATRRSGLILLAVVGFTIVAWASAFVAIRAVGEELSPGALALGRLLVGTAVLGLLMTGRGWVRPDRGEWGRLAACGIGWFGVYNVALNAAEQHLDAGTTAMLVNIGPILIALFAGLLLGEGFPRWLLAGIAVAFAGVVLIGLATLQVTFTACAIGTLCVLPWAGALAGELGRASAGSVAGMVYLGVVPTALAFSTWAYALRRMDAGKLGVTTYLVPPLVILMGWLLLDEVPPVLALVGGGICLAGVALSRRRGRVRPPGPLTQEPGPAQ